MSLCHFTRPNLRKQIVEGREPEWLKRHDRRPYIVGVALSTPPWVERAELLALRDEARRLSIARGTPYVLDHVVPVHHPRVCGLTVPWNIKIIPDKVNMSKGNDWNPDQVELWDVEDPEPHQLCLL